MRRKLFENLFNSAKNPTSEASRKRNRNRKSNLSYDSLEERALLASYVPGEVLVQYEASANLTQRTDARASVAGSVLQHIHTKPMLDAGKGVLERVSLNPNMSVQGAANVLKNMPGVKFAEPNYIYTKSLVSNDQRYVSGQLWGMYSSDSPISAGPSGTTNQFGSQAEQAWRQGFTGSNDVYIGVIDEGIQVDHPDLIDNIWVNPFDTGDGIDNDGNGRIDDIHGWNFYNNNNVVYDGVGDKHGTHVAGTIGAKGGNLIGVAGVNWNVKIISAKFMGPNGGSSFSAAQALDYLTDLKVRHGLNIVATNNSWGGGGYSLTMLNAITRAANQGILFVAAAGNSSGNSDTNPIYPASYDTTAGAGYNAVISVASITSTGAMSSFSNYGANSVHLGAPGSSIQSTLPGGYGSYSGTSMAAPHVTGALALYAAANPNLSAYQLRGHLLNSTTATASLAGKTVTGGRLDISKMFLSTPPPSLPSLSINNVSVVEGNSGTTQAVFTVTMSASSTNSVSVNYATANGAATAGSDYQATSGTLTFSPGQTSRTISVTVYGDTEVEPNETFQVNLSTATNANIGNGTGVGTILNDDVAQQLMLSVANSSQIENQPFMFFTVTLSSPSTSSVTVKYATANGTAKGGKGKNADFSHANGTLTFAPGETSKVVAVALKDDTLVEGDEFFYLRLSSSVGATISNSQAIGTIIDDDFGGSAMNVFAKKTKKAAKGNQKLVGGMDKFDNQKNKVKAGRKARR